MITTSAEGADALLARFAEAVAPATASGDRADVETRLRARAHVTRFEEGDVVVELLRREDYGCRSGCQLVASSVGASVHL